MLSIVIQNSLPQAVHVIVLNLFLMDNDSEQIMCNTYVQNSTNKSYQNSVSYIWNSRTTQKFTNSLHGVLTIVNSANDKCCHSTKLEVDGKPVENTSARARTDRQTTQKHNVCRPIYRMSRCTKIPQTNNVWQLMRTDSNMAPVSPMLPLGVTPSPPIRPAHKSLPAHSITSNTALHIYCCTNTLPILLY